MAFTLAALKRKLTPGTVIYLRECLTGPVAAENATREVRENRPSFVAFNIPGKDRPSYLYWPNAAAVKETRDGFAVYEDGRLAARYSWQAPLPGDVGPTHAPGKPGFWVIGTNAPELRAALVEMKKRVPAGVELDHKEAALGVAHGWTINEDNLAAFIAAVEAV
jgi:hypothetical protein